jgi:hypothetical protein
MSGAALAPTCSADPSSPPRAARAAGRPGHPRGALAGRVGLAALLAIAGSGCVTAAAIARPQRVSIPLLLGAAAADLVIVSGLASQAQDFSAGAALATGLAVTAVDVGAGCILGACQALRP